MSVMGNIHGHLMQKKGRRRKTDAISYNTCYIHTETCKVLKFVGSSEPEPVPLTEGRRAASL
jgi:hypothetical protein